MHFLKKISNSPEVSKWLPLIILIITVTVITYYRIQLQIYLGPISDTYDLLANAALFAGKGFGYTDLTRPPFFSLLTSAFFLFNGLYKWSIFVVDGVLYIFGCVGFYLLLKERFDSLMSFLGSLLFATFPLMITFVGAGYNEVSGVCIGIWVIYLTYLAVNNNSKYFFLSFPMAMIAFLTRYNMALIIFPIFLYILINRAKIKDSKNIFIGIVLSSLILIPILLFFNVKLGDPLVPFLSFFNTSGGSSLTEHFAYNSDLFYFLKNMPVYLGAQSALILLFTAVGIVVYLFKNLNKIRSENKSLSFDFRSLIDLKILLTVIMLFLFVLTFGKIHYMFSELIFFIIAFLIYLISFNKMIDLDMDLLFLSWFMTFFIFQSVYVLKDHRYVISMYPPIAYFLIRGIQWASNVLKIGHRGKNITKYFLTIFIILIMLSSVLYQFESVEKGNLLVKDLNQDIMLASNWIINYDSEYRSKVIYADFNSYFAWNLKMNIGRMPIFKNNQKLYAGGTEDSNFSNEDYIALDNELNIIKPDYYIAIVWRDSNFTSFVPVKKIGKVTIYQRIN